MLRDTIFQCCETWNDVLLQQWIYADDCKRRNIETVNSFWNLYIILHISLNLYLFNSIICIYHFIYVLHYGIYINLHDWSHMKGFFFFLISGSLWPFQYLFALILFITMVKRWHWTREKKVLNVVRTWCEIVVRDIFFLPP